MAFHVEVYIYTIHINIFFQTHSVHFSTNSAMAHVREFSQAFRCPVNSPMNPAKKCNLY